MLAYLFILLYGVGAGARGTSFVSLKADIFPGKSFGRILGFSQLGAGLASGLGPWAAGYIFDVTGSYMIPFLGLAICNLVGAVLIMLTPKPTVDLNQQTDQAKA